MIELAFFISLDAVALVLTVPNFYQTQVKELGRRAPIRCDDGSSPRRPDGSPNWNCEIRGCGPHESTCWSDRIDFCFNESGDDAGICLWEEPQTCKSILSCIDLWSGCNGEWSCSSPIPCNDGVCTPKPKTKPKPETKPSVRAVHECALDGRAIQSEPVNESTPAEDLPQANATDSVGGHGDV